MKQQKKVLCFGTFDPLHEGHRNFFAQARALGDYLQVVVSRDAVIKSAKFRPPHQTESARLLAVRAEKNVDEAILGEATPHSYSLLRALDFDILALGYDQEPEDQQVQAELKKIGKDKIRLVRLAAFLPEHYKSAKFRSMYDLHLHSLFSDGDVNIADLVKAARVAGIKGISVTDHDGLWGMAALAQEAQSHNIEWLEGIEVSTLHQQVRLHILGYSRMFDQAIIQSGLSLVRRGHEERVKKIIQLARHAGYPRLSFEYIQALRQKQLSPVYVTYDVELALRHIYKLSSQAAHQLLVPGGDLYLDYDSQMSLTPAAAIELIHSAGGVAILAHPGIIALEHSMAKAWEIIDILRPQLDGLEVHHPVHDTDFIEQLTRYAISNNLLITGGSDWHGQGRYDDKSLGKIGINEKDWQTLQSALG